MCNNIKRHTNEDIYKSITVDSFYNPLENLKYQDTL